MEDGGLFALARHAVLAQFGQQRIYLLIGLLNILLFPHGHDHTRKRLRIFPRGGKAVFVVTLVQGFECALPLSRIFDELDDSVFMGLRVNTMVDIHAHKPGLRREHETHAGVEKTLAAFQRLLHAAPCCRICRRRRLSSACIHGHFSDPALPLIWHSLPADPVSVFRKRLRKPYVHICAPPQFDPLVHE